MKPKVCDICKKPKPIEKMFFVWDAMDERAHIMRCFECERQRLATKAKGQE